MTFQFKCHIIDTDLPVTQYAQTALADLDGDGRLEYIVGQQYGSLFWYKYHAPDRWTRHLLGTDSPSDVGGCTLDVDGDGHIDFVIGGAWYRNSRNPDKPFERIVFDAELTAVHDVVAADIDGDGDLDVLSCEMEAVRGERPPRYYIWENLDGKGGAWQEHVILDANLGGHQVVAGDMTGNGLPDIIAKPWRAHEQNALDGKMFVLFLENVSTS